MNGTKLMKISYRDYKAEIFLEAYADTVVYEKEPESGTNTLAAIRFGGYPESVRGMTEAIYTKCLMPLFITMLNIEKN